jgi:hypothetical protein
LHFRDSSKRRQAEGRAKQKSQVVAGSSTTFTGKPHCPPSSKPGHRRPIRSRCRIYSTETTPGRRTEVPACSSMMTTHHADGRRRSHAQPRRRRSPRCRPGFGDLLLVCGHARMCVCTNRPIKKKGTDEAPFIAEISDITSLYTIRFLPHTLQ